MLFEKKYLHSLFDDRRHSVVENTLLAEGEVSDYQIIFSYDNKTYQAFYAINKSDGGHRIFLEHTVPAKNSVINCNEVELITVQQWVRKEF